MQAGRNLEYVQAYNQRLILDIIRLHGPISRADIARQSGLAAPTVSRITSDLLQHGFIIEQSRRHGNLGKPPIELMLNPNGAYAIGFNFDRDQLVGVLINLSGTVLERVQHDPSIGSPETVLPLMQQTAQLFLERSCQDGKPVLGIGVGIPGPLHINPVPSTNLFELPGWAGINVQDEMNRLFGLPTYLENNPIAAAIGELWHGKGRDIANFYYIFFGLYLGGCAVVNRQPIMGSGGFAGEFGSIPYGITLNEPDGVRRLGHSVSLAALYNELIKHGYTECNSVALKQLYRDRNPYLLAWLDRVVEQLAPELWRLECIFDPEAIVFGERLPSPLVMHLISHLEPRLAAVRVRYKPYGPKLLHGWVGIDAAPLGAATLPIYNALSPSPNLIVARMEEMRMSAALGELF